MSVSVFVREGEWPLEYVRLTFPCASSLSRTDSRLLRICNTLALGQSASKRMRSWKPPRISREGAKARSTRLDRDALWQGGGSGFIESILVKGLLGALLELKRTFL